jgi:hypothetical protein
MQNYIMLTPKILNFLCTYYFKCSNNHYYLFYNLKGKKYQLFYEHIISRVETIITIFCLQFEGENK